LRVSMSGEGEGFVPPSINEFFPPQLFGEGTWWGPTRINLIGLLMAGVLSLFFVLAFKRTTIVPRGLQNLGEMAVDVVQVNIIDEVMGVRGRRFAPLLITLFWMILVFNVSGILPLLHMPATAVIGVPLVLAVVVYAVFNWAGIKASGVGSYLKMNLIPPGIPKPLYVLVIPIEFVSTFLLRPFTLAIRLMANMMAGHLLLVLFYSATSYFLFEAQGLIKSVGVVSYAAGFAFTLFECLVIILQAYIFTLLTAVYIDGATSAEH
jgi:F-type H+-transporting ATPase subunit a